MASTVECKASETVAKQAIYLCCNFIQLWLQRSGANSNNSPIATHH